MIQNRAIGIAHKEELLESLKSYGKGHALQKCMDSKVEIPVRLIKDRWQSSVMRGISDIMTLYQYYLLIQKLYLYSIFATSLNVNCFAIL